MDIREVRAHGSTALKHGRSRSKVCGSVVLKQRCLQKKFLELCLDIEDRSRACGSAALEHEVH
jgi:hypothetical protein